MSTNIETRRVKEALGLQVAAVQTYATRMLSQDLDELGTGFADLERAVAELRGIVESLPHRSGHTPPAGSPSASPATTRPEREAKGAATADVTQRPKE